MSPVPSTSLYWKIDWRIDAFPSFYGRINDIAILPVKDAFRKGKRCDFPEMEGVVK